MCSCQGAGQANEIATISGGNDGEVPPVPIPNTEVKHFNGDNSWACPCEDSKLLGFFMSDPLSACEPANRQAAGSFFYAFL